MTSLHHDMEMTRIHERERGYTLIELSMVFIIIGILVSGTLTAYSLYYGQSQATETEEEITQIAAKLEDYRIKHGRYPCPASLLMREGQAGFARQVNCTSHKNFNKACTNGVCTSDGQRNLDAIPYPIPDNIRDKIPRETTILIGTLPALDLELGEDFATDGYNTPYLYAVTGDMAIENPDGYDLGAIEIVDEKDRSVMSDRGNAAFVILSFGPNQSGFMGEPTLPCSRRLDRQQRNLETENCDLDGRFRIADFSQAGGWSYYDDTIFYTHSHARPKWQPLFNQSGDLINKFKDTTTITVGSFKIGEGLNVNPRDEETKYPVIDASLLYPKLEVHGNVNIKDKAISAGLCNQNFQDCFEHGTIAGAGMRCPKGQSMLGIRESEPMCIDRVECPAGLFITELDSSLTGNACTHLPTSCAPLEVEICGKPVMLPYVDNFQTFNINMGFNRQEKYACEFDRWTFKSASGDCKCQSKSREVRSPCPDPMQKGYLLVREEIKCAGDSGEYEPTRILENNCKCTSVTQKRSQPCSDGFVGELVEQRHSSCPGGKWGEWAIVQDNCKQSFDIAN